MAQQIAEMWVVEMMVIRTGAQRGRHASGREIRHMRRRGLWIGRVAVLMSIVLSLCAVTAVGAAAYRDPNGRFAITIPSGWSSMSPVFDSSVAAWSSTDGLAQVEIGYTTLAPGTSALALAQAEYRQISAQAGVQFVGSDTVSAAGDAQPIAQYTVTDNSGSRFDLEKIYVVNNTDGWSLILVTPDGDPGSHAADYIAMASTVRHE